LSASAPEDASPGPTAAASPGGGAASGEEREPAWSARRGEYGAISIGDRAVRVAVDAVMRDGTPTTTGAAGQIAPPVQLPIATHPVGPEPRRWGLEVRSRAVCG
jgi:hypothetical protein